ncbi:hypothetical protein [Nocardioides hwasunensis]|uniref:hypothetical protein n=1 Tax=Nocardioides hwasunensis TaxID=397258 RepID=UPI002965374C|nr:hypothetical protein [Nocardioides hwasunensis]
MAVPPSISAAHPACLQAPIDRHTHVVLRAAVLELVETERGRTFPVVLHAGVPGRSVRHRDDPSYDVGLRADVVVAMLRRAAVLTQRPRLWLTRPGELSPHDADLRWLGPARWASSALGSPTGLVVVTRRGWFDPVSDVRREWRRLRPRTD